MSTCFTFCRPCRHTRQETWMRAFRREGVHGEAYRGHIFWDELFVFPFLNTATSRTHARTAALPLPATTGRSATRPGTWIFGCTFPLAEWQRRPRGDAVGTAEPDLRPMGARQLATAVPHQPRDCLQRVALLGDHGRSRLPHRLRRGAPRGERAVLGEPCDLRCRGRPLRRPRGDGPGRVPRRISGQSGWRHRQQRLHQ